MKEKDSDIRAEISVSRDHSGEYDCYLVIKSQGKTWPYLYIPESMPDDVLATVLKKLNA